MGWSSIRTHEVVPYSRELDEVLELWMTQNLSRHGVLPRVLDDTLWLAVLVLLNLDHAWGERLLELVLMFAWNGPTKGDMREKAV